MINIKNYTLSFAWIPFFFTLWWIPSKPITKNSKRRPYTLFYDSIPQDTIKQDTIEPYKKSKQPVPNPSDRLGDPFSNPESLSPLYLKDPKSFQLQEEIDTSMNYTIHEKVNELNYRPSTTLSFEEYQKLREREMLKNYWKAKSQGLDGQSAVSGRRLIPKIYVSEGIDRIFGGSFIDIQPNGFVTLNFGMRWQRINNPSLPVRQQRPPPIFDFDQKISLNVIGKVGEKLAITANFDNNSSFDFRNDLKVEYTGFEEEIIKKIEIGNVSMPVSNSLITGAQNLFGIKTQLQFGRLYVTGVASNQRGQSESIEIEGASQTRDFEIQASEYEENRHFFLSQFFRDNYEKSLQNLPQVLSGVNITRVEVYVLNRTNNTQTLRNIAAFMDLGEGEHIYRNSADFPKIFPGQGNVPTSNDANQLFTNLKADPNFRSKDQITSLLESSFKLVNSTDFEVVAPARKLDNTEFTINKQLGYISLNRKLNNDELLAVSYEYTYNGQVYKVGELTEDYQNLPEDKVIFLKLLRPRKINTKVPTWDLMMKNIYKLGGSQINKESFQLRIIYRDDKTGLDNPSLHEGINTKDIPLIELLGLDQLNPQNDPPKDGNFDFIEGVTINSSDGTIIFPVLEPFGKQLEEQFLENEKTLINKYVYDTLYRTTQADARLITTLNKFFLNGKYSAGSSNEINLGINIAENSVQVFAGNTLLAENVDYRVDYNFGTLTILNQGILNSGKKLRIVYEKADLFNFQSRTLLGTHLDYILNKDISIGASLLHLVERPIITRVSIGDEPNKNTKWGLNININKESRFLTKLVDALPLIQTKEKSNISFNAEFAQMFPATSNKVNDEGASYIDDFEYTITPYNLISSRESWKLASTPQTEEDQFDLSNQTPDNLGFAYKRAKLAWYIVDNAFYDDSRRPENISKEDDLQNNYVRPIVPQEVFRQQQPQINVNIYQPVFDLAYYPYERGPYNYNPDINVQGLLNDPASNWGGITRAITSDVDFDKTNIEYLEFWLMDPFIEGENGKVIDGFFDQNNTTGGKLYFNLGSVSEDIMKDSRHAFENGLPPDGSLDNTAENEWGRVTTQQYITNAFNNEPSARSNQDVGLDGLKNEEESIKFQDFLNNIPASAKENIEKDPSADDFTHYLDESYDISNAKVLERYKKFNGLDGNTPLASGNLSYAPSGSIYPDNEDLNQDNTVNELEEYYEYEVDLKPGELSKDKKYIVDQIEGENGANWYLFRIPIRQPDRVQGSINGFKSIRFLRMYMTGFEQPVVLRFAKMQFVGSQWRKYLSSLKQNNLEEIEDPEPVDDDFVISVVNIEENNQPGEGKIPYVLPPGIIRDQDNTSIVNRQLNEQSMQLCVDQLEDKDARAVYKNVNLDVINYGRLKMFIHAQSETAQDDEVTAFIRMGTDFDQNYYEIEVPLKITPNSAQVDTEIWPSVNGLDIAFNELYALKANRNRNNIPITQAYTEGLRQYRITVKGRPELSTIMTLMVGIRNPNYDNDLNTGSHSACIWVNELRVTDFDSRAGWATNARLNAKLADFANLTASTSYTSVGYGNIQQKISERTRDETLDLDFSGSFNLDKFVPESFAISVPMYVGYQTTRITPFFDPLDPDIPLDVALSTISDPTERAQYYDIVLDKSVRRSINFTNVRKLKNENNTKKHFYDVANLAFTYAYNDLNRSNINTAEFFSKNYKVGISYNYNFSELSIQPFKKIKFLKSPWLKLIKDFNFSPIPSTVSVRADLDRNFIKTQLRNSNLTTNNIAPYFEKFFTFNRSYNLRWNLAKSLALDYNARTNAIIDEPDGEINTKTERKEIWNNLSDFGRVKNFNQNIIATYRLPFDKLPLTDWVGADLRYSVGYTWTSGALDQIDTLGNTIQNNRERGLNSKIDFIKLYNKSKFLKSINSPKRKRSKKDDKNNKENGNEGSVVKGFLRILMALRSINVNYTMTEGTLLPGYTQSMNLLGMDESFQAPGWDFILGSQNPIIKDRAAENIWLAENPSLTMPFSQSLTNNLTIRAQIEPFRDLRIQMDFRKNKSATYQEIFRYDTTNALNEFRTFSPSRSGSFNISYLSIATHFIGDREDNSSPVFEKFAAYRTAFKERLDNQNESGTYNINNQDVLIPAFLAAYSGTPIDKARNTLFPSIPLPNWRIDYAGLSKIKAISNIFSAFSINHSYNASYTINNYTNSLLYSNNLDLTHNIENYPQAGILNDQGELIPIYIINQVTISEQFAPLIGVNVRTKSQFTGRVEYRTERNVSLNMSNTQVTELKSNDIVLDIGYTKAGIKLPFKSKGRVITLKNDLTFRINFTIRDTRTIQRKIDELDIITSGNINFQLKPTINYAFNERLSLQVYYEKNINEPRVSNSFRRTTTAFGFQLRFNLAQ